MRYAQAFIPTLKESPAEAQVASHVFMIRGGYLRKAAAGVYSFLPLGWRVIQKIAGLVREEMDRAGAIEIHMPAAVPAELWQESGRWQKYGPELLRFKDRKGADFLIGPTHEEVVVDLVRREVKSYRELPLALYQVQTKFRDEVRPRAGLLRGREFLMKDAYSFHTSVASAQTTYKAMFEAYGRIFRRAGLDFRAVEADTGAIGGSLSHEFQVLARSGEDKLVACDACSYAANVEQAELRREAGAGEIERRIFLVDGAAVAVLVRAGHEVNEIKLRKHLGASEVFPAAAPVEPRRTLGDLDARDGRDGVEWADLRLATEGDGCPRCAAGRLRGFLGIEVGHVFYLGQKYAAPMGCTFLDEHGKTQVMEMGCYGIGVTRVAAAAIEQHHDEAGIVWPMSIAPYQVTLLTLQAKDPAVVAAADELYARLVAAGIEVLYDDRDERPGTKFKDADLLGVPLRIAVGKKSLAEGQLELKWRRDPEAQRIDAAGAADHIASLVRSELARLGAG